MQMKNILGILLAVCFVMSVTAAAVSADPYTDHKDVNDHKDVKKDDHRSDFNQKDNHIEYRNNYHHNHYHPGHWEKHREGHKEYRNNHWVVVYKIVTVYKTAYWN